MDPATLTNSTIVLTDEVGTIVRGSTAVSSTADNTLEFTPEQPLALLARYTGTIAAELASKSGTAIAATPDWQFSIREGAWQASTQLELGGSTIGPKVTIGADDAGNVFAVWPRSNGVRTDARFSQYSHAEKRWTTASDLDMSDDNVNSLTLSVSAGGSALAIWTRELMTGDGQVWSRLYKPNGGWAAAERLDSQLGSVAGIATTIDSTGNIVAAWSHRSPTDSRATIQTRQRSTSRGWAATEPVVHDTVGDAETIRLVTDTFGNAVMLWHENDGVCSSTARPAFGFDTPVRLGVSQEDNKGPSGEIAVDGQGKRMAVWVGPDGGVGSVYWSRWSSASGWSTANLLETENLGPASRPNVAVRENGDAVAVWVHDNGNQVRLRMRTYSLASQSWNSAVDLDQANGGVFPITPSILFDSRGNGIVAWTQLEQGDLFAFYSRYSAADDSWTAPLKISDSPNTGAPATAVDSSGRISIVWFGGGSKTGFSEVWTRRFE